MNRAKPVTSLRRPAVLAIAAIIMASGAGTSLAADENHRGVSVPAHAAAHVSSGPVASSPAKTAAETAFTQVLAGTYYSVGLRADGSVWTWGRNLYGELGLPGTSAVGSVNSPVRLVGLTGIRSIATSGSGYQLAVKDDGTVWEWGSHLRNSTETLPPRQFPLLTRVAQVATQHAVNFALKQDGSLWAWTKDVDTGKIGQPFEIKHTGKYVSLSVAGDTAYTLDDAGSLWVIRAERQDHRLNVLPPVRVSGLPALKQVTGDFSSGMYGIDRSGTAWKWSLTPSAASYKLSGKPIKLYPGLKFKQAASSGLTMLLTEQGEVWTYGKGPDGKEGKVKGLKGIVALSPGSRHALAIDAQGQVWGWGANQWNEVGVRRNSQDGMEYAPKRLQIPITVKVNGSLLSSSFPATMSGNLINVPLKDAAKALGAELKTPTTAEHGGMYTLKYKDTSVDFRPGYNEVDINGKKVLLPSPITAENGATMIPASLLKQMGFTVTWDSKRSELAITGA